MSVSRDSSRNVLIICKNNSSNRKRNIQDETLPPSSPVAPRHILTCCLEKLMLLGDHVNLWFFVTSQAS